VARAGTSSDVPGKFCAGGTTLRLPAYHCSQPLPLPSGNSLSAPYPSSRRPVEACTVPCWPQGLFRWKLPVKVCADVHYGHDFAPLARSRLTRLILALHSCTIDGTVVYCCRKDLVRASICTSSRFTVCRCRRSQSAANVKSLKRSHHITKVL